MPSTGPLLASGSRPLPEYELVSLLGRSGFGEVWKAQGPGGFEVALKFIRLSDKADRVETRGNHAHQRKPTALRLPAFQAPQWGDQRTRSSRAKGRHPAAAADRPPRLPGSS